ncbi:hypothetical protein [Pseudobdellovibrio exovorus]|uniref:Uncharacterized protein n=1 Tax=Pseudobdellovibrio exovorus JSS TaxID=1184267 RepID=M4VPX1_9BACT|nr:hypothetical protein [Pseudobdellovibrio exovorus]AGH95189.1 hypothetical protein A11Q_973 [Pseudobdellovibrio exovorus JSS]
MLRQKIKLFVIFSILSSTAFSAVNEDTKLLEELTGKKHVTKQDILAKRSAAQSPAQLILRQAREASIQRQYRQALEHYDRVIRHYANTQEVVQAYKGKADLYTEMGLESPAQLNRQLADKAGQKFIK